MRNLHTFRDRRFKGTLIFKTVIAALAAVLFTASAHAIDPNRTISQYIRERWGSEKGFTAGAVTAIAQTADGYLWIGTEKGLIRFDGLSFRPFQQASPASFPIGPVQSLIADVQGNLWILLQSTKILRYHDGKFELGRDEAEAGITAISRRRDGTPLFSSLALGGLKYDSGKFEAIFSSSQPATSANTASAGLADDFSSRLSWATGVVPHRFAEPNSAVISMAETADGKIWLGTLDKGLFYVSEGRVFSAGKGLPSNRINCILALDNRELWIATDKGVVRWNGTEITSAGVPLSLRKTRVNSIVRDRDSNIWLATSRGLIRLNAEGVSVDGADTRVNERVTALFEDREGNLWIGGPHSIERLRDSTFLTYSVGGQQSESGGAIFVDEDERVWFAPIEGGLDWLKGDKSGSVEINRLGQDVIYSITGSKEELWIGRRQGGLTHLFYKAGSIYAQSYTEANGLAQNSVYAVHRSRDGTVWAGTLTGGVSQFRDGRFTTYTTANGLSSNTVNSIAETPDGTMWFATPEGVTALSRGKWQVFETVDGLPSANVNCLSSDSSGVLWIGTASGIAVIRSGHIQPSGELPPSLQDQILGIAVDGKGWLWISTPNHVLRVNREKLLESSLTDADIREYGLEDGLHGIEGVKRHQSVFADPLGKIWLSMNRGLSVVDPARVIASSAPAIVHVEGISADGNPLGLQAPIRLPGVRRRITFNYAGLSLSVPERVRFKYKLEGLDEGWSNPVTARDVTYNNLGSGTYRFRVVASNSDGLWNGEESVVPFEIAPAYWQTWWFRLSAVVASALAILLFVRLRLRRLTAQMNIRFEERLAERTRIAQELHDTLLQGVLSASMQLHVADERLPEQSPAKPMVGRVLELMTRVIDEGRNTVRGLRSSTSTQKSLEQAFSELQQELPSPIQSTFRVIVEGNPRQLRTSSRDEIYFIGREGLANAFRHSRATEIVMEIEYAGNHLRILVRDNGCGIDPHVLNSGREGHWGLSGMRERAERIGARLRVLSRTDAGTEIELSVPSRMAFEPGVSKRPKLWFSKLYSREARKDKRPESESVHR